VLARISDRQRQLKVDRVESLAGASHPLQLRRRWQIAEGAD
jgi:hypothetical protein